MAIYFLLKLLRLLISVIRAFRYGHRQLTQISPLPAREAVYDETTGSSFPDSQVVLQAIAHPEPRSLTLKLDRICAVVIARSDL